MNTLGDRLGKLQADKLVQDHLKIGDIHIISLDERNGITPKNGKNVRDKFFIVLGFDAQGNVIGGLVINSKINYNLPPNVTDYQLPITVAQCPFLKHDSFVNCSRLITASRTKFSVETYRGEIADNALRTLILATVKESPTVNKRMLEIFGII